MGKNDWRPYNFKGMDIKRCGMFDYCCCNIGECRREGFNKTTLSETIKTPSRKRIQ